MARTRLTLLSRSQAETRGKLHLEPGQGEPRTVILSESGGDDYLCGYCGTVLIANVERPMLGNGAVHCNKCGRYSDGFRPAKYKQVPTMNEDVEKLLRPTESYKPLEGGPPCPHDDVLQRLHREFVNAWSQAQGERPRRLYHYTTLEGLKGILQTNQIWVTDVAYLNDTLELQLGGSLIEDCLTRHEEIVPNKCKELLKRARIDFSPNNASSGYYVVCFCESRDLVSQWQGYAAKTTGYGYAVGFSAYEMATEGLVALRRVIYDPNQQRKLVDDTIERICAGFEKIAGSRPIKEMQADHTLPSFAMLMASHLREYVATFKHYTFENEKEWRIVLPWRRDHHLKFVRFRGDRGSAVPYMQLHPRTPTEEMPLLPIIEVIHGPTVYPDLTRKSLHLLLQSTDYDHVEVDGSRAPLRP